MKTKEFDCVEMKHLGADIFRAKAAGLTKEQELRFWQEQSKRLRICQETIRLERSQQNPGNPPSVDHPGADIHTPHVDRPI